MTERRREIRRENLWEVEKRMEERREIRLFTLVSTITSN